ncbi:MAG: hypothetical protein MHM6MM_005743 [Cercozoa sp. M6MM]
MVSAGAAWASGAISFFAGTFSTMAWTFMSMTALSHIGHRDDSMYSDEEYRKILLGFSACCAPFGAAVSLALTLLSLYQWDIDEVNAVLIGQSAIWGLGALVCALAGVARCLHRRRDSTREPTAAR